MTSNKNQAAKKNYTNVDDLADQMWAAALKYSSRANEKIPKLPKPNNNSQDVSSFL